MKTAAIICEYNPFHNGHLYHIEETKRILGADYIIALMSGNYVQRGAPAVIEKKTRARMALMNGADLALELPLWFSSGSAPYFADGSVALLEGLGVVDILSFGSECGSLSLLIPLGSLLADREEDLTEQIRKFLKTGISYPKAREKAILSLGCSKSDADILREPNNLLGLEYIMALKRRNSSIRPFCIPRKQSSHRSLDLTGSISSASAIRSQLTVFDGLNKCLESMPETLHPILREDYRRRFPILLDDFSDLLSYKLCMEDSFEDYWDVSKDLSDRLISMTVPGQPFSCQIEAVKNKSLTWSRISRGLLHILLGMKQEIKDSYTRSEQPLYFQILGFKKEASSLIREIKKKKTWPMVRHLRPLDDPLTKVQEQMLQTERKADALYQMMLRAKFKTQVKEEQIII